MAFFGSSCLLIDILFQMFFCGCCVYIAWASMSISVIKLLGRRLHRLEIAQGLASRLKNIELEKTVNDAWTDIGRHGNRADL